MSIFGLGGLSPGDRVLLADQLFQDACHKRLLAFGAGIYYAAYLTLWAKVHPQPDALPRIVVYFVTAVNGTLAANLGAILGISVSMGEWPGPIGTTETMQWIAAAWYVVMLMFATIAWGLVGFTDDPTLIVPLLPEMTKNAIGIFIAILAAVLGVHTFAMRVKRERGEA